MLQGKNKVSPLFYSKKECGTFKKEWHIKIEMYQEMYWPQFC